MGGRARAVVALSLLLAGASLALAAGCGNSSTYQGGGRMLEPPGDNGYGLEPADSGSNSGDSPNDQSSSEDVDSNFDE